MKSSVAQIRQRLLVLLGRAFVGVLLFFLILFPLGTGYFLTNISSTETSLRLPVIGYLEGYYLARGNWDGVGTAFQTYDEFPQEYTVLLDVDNRIILDGGIATTSRVGTIYEAVPGDIRLALTANTQPVGTLVIKSLPLAWRGRFASGILYPIFVLSLVMVLLLLVVAYLLMRRFVNPLADVIYAANAVANGKLDTRIHTEGPQDLQTLSESFNDMASALERSDRERRDMLADIAHELRTPLSVIRGRLEGIVDGIYPEKGPQVSTALEQTYLLERLVDDLRLLTLVETRQLVFDKTEVHAGKLIDAVLEILSAQAKEKNISLAYMEDGDIPAIRLDPQRLEQVLSNLIGNALRYVPEGGRVWVTAQESHDGLQIMINDNGTGIPEDDLPFIFERFWRKDKSRSRHSGGTGLGLAISKQLIEAQGGSIEAQNLTAGGLQVKIKLPRSG